MLSLVIGFLSGGSAGMVFLRALAGGFLFGLLANVIRFIINRFLPELMEPMTPQAEEPLEEDDSREDQGERVNIVLDDEDSAMDAAGSSETVFQDEGLKEVTEEASSGGGESAFEEGGLPPSSPSEEIEKPDEPEDVPPGLSGTDPLAEKEIPEVDAFEGKSEGFAGGDLLKDKFLGPTNLAESMGNTHGIEEMARAVQNALQKDQKG